MFTSSLPSRIGAVLEVLGMVTLTAVAKNGVTYMSLRTEDTSDAS